MLCLDGVGVCSFSEGDALTRCGNFRWRGDYLGFLCCFVLFILSCPKVGMGVLWRPSFTFFFLIGEIFLIMNKLVDSEIFGGFHTYNL